MRNNRLQLANALANRRDVLHPGRANVSKDELRGKLAEMYKAGKDQVSVFGFRTHYGGGKSTGFALLYDSAEALKKFEPHYRLVRIGQATKIERASRQQRTLRRGSMARGRRSVSAIVVDADTAIQESKERTGRRRSGERPRPRARRRRRKTNERRARALVGLSWLVVMELQGRLFQSV